MTSKPIPLITIEDIRAAAGRLAGVAVHTPLLRAQAVPPVDSVALYFKPESFQPIGSFKVRGAYNRIAAIPPEVRANGVIAYSSGNHAQGVAYAARRLGIPATIVMPDNAPAVKIAATRAYGAHVILYDATREKREAVAARWMEQQGGAPATLVPPFNDPYVIAGQGTVGLEIAQDLPEVDLALTPIGGGGLISGTAVALKDANPHVRVIGVEPAIANDAQQSLRSGHIVELPASQTNQTLADGVRTLAVGDLTFAHLTHLIDDILTVTEEQIRAAARHLILNEKLVVEPTSALPLAAWLAHQEALLALRPRSVVMVLSGGNIEPALLAELVAP